MLSLAVGRQSHLIGCLNVAIKNHKQSRQLGTKPNASISDDNIAKLAAKPLHSLTLEDLVKYGLWV